ncbi:MAG: alpha/beta fold hydrolase [Sandaracinus sp.]|nr:alpha/beta fold hydrolase [Sandaracinus sp.]
MSFVFLHGFAGSPRVFDDFVTRHGGLAPTLLGHATEEGEGDSDAATFELEVDRLLALAPPRATWVGYSMGGRLAFGAAARAPERVKRLIVLAGHPGLEDEAERARRREDDEARAQTLEREGLEAFFAAWDALPMFARRTPPTRVGSNAAGLARALRVLGTGAMPSYWRPVAEATTPLAYVVGEHDTTYRALAARLHALRSDVSIVVAPGADHDVLGCGDDARHTLERLLSEPS